MASLDAKHVSCDWNFSINTNRTAILNGKHYTEKTLSRPQRTLLNGTWALHKEMLDI